MSVQEHWTCNFSLGFQLICFRYVWLRCICKATNIDGSFSFFFPSHFPFIFDRISRFSMEKILFIEFIFRFLLQFEWFFCSVLSPFECSIRVISFVIRQSEIHLIGSSSFVWLKSRQIRCHSYRQYTTDAPSGFGCPKLITNSQTNKSISFVSVTTET